MITQNGTRVKTESVARRRKETGDKTDAIVAQIMTAFIDHMDDMKELDWWRITIAMEKVFNKTHSGAYLIKLDESNIDTVADDVYIAFADYVYLGRNEIKKRVKKIIENGLYGFTIVSKAC